MQVCWDQAFAKHMGLADRYEKVAVLLIKWEDNLDELRTKEETEELRDIFRDQFHYACNIVELDVMTKPQHQMNKHISDFVNAHDGPNSLLIVYYTGHGVYNENLHCLEMTASIDPFSKFGFKFAARANWNKAEEQLRVDDVEGDVLTILDTCYASNLQKSGKESSRTFELLSACVMDATTAGPGKRSFTRALIDALNELLQEHRGRPFTTFHLNQRILENPIRHSEPSQLWYRLKHHERHISLAPLKPKSGPSIHNALRKLPRGYLTLQFALDYASLNEEQIELLSHKLATALKNSRLGLRNIDWLGMKAARITHLGRAALAMYAVSQWKKVARQRREARLGRAYKSDGGDAPQTDPKAALGVGSHVTLHPRATTQVQASPARKRNREQEDYALPLSKRSSLPLPPNGDQPPSPPVSVTSRVDESSDADVHMG
ncbi:hypothetical protein M011DRAFT_394090 [Sporormia fimetaria CBS 119925]|uniref:Uncharacterized protein n=1 Tax=Sporormia fimetaria CBS 119925 TaxID=1340428 RepID=A0A6A6VQ62_9PLEO|nr:hypothetical protein M011DRAFT_394090 [Sporormia fimetaria CBS 119925]